MFLFIKQTNKIFRIGEGEYKRDVKYTKIGDVTTVERPKQAHYIVNFLLFEVKK